MSAVPEPRDRPSWLSQELFPFESRYLEVGGAAVHYVDEGSGRPLLMLHGNPTWSFLYRELIKGLRDRYRCIALDYPGFGLSHAPAGYGHTPAEHSRVLEQVILALDLAEVTLMTQDWGGPIGFGAAIRHPTRFTAFVIANTWAWPKSDLPTQVFSRLLGGPIGGYLIRHRNVFVEKILPSNVKRTTLPPAVMNAYRGPFPTPQSREPVHVLPRQILAARGFLASVEAGLASLSDRPALVLWPTKDPAMRERERQRWEQVFPEHRTVLMEGAGHYVQEDAPGEMVAAIREWGGRSATPT